MSKRVASSFYDDRGIAVHLGSELGRGGEGSVVEVVGQPNMVAKVYHQPLSAQKSQKLLAMARGTDDRLLKIAAWPVQTLHLTRGGPVCGFVMPKVTNHQELHLLHGPKSRLQHFPEARWPFLVHAALNAARAFKIIHDHGHVIGDVNDRNLLVSADGTVKFIDCDSFQIRAGTNLFPCEVGVPNYTSPELQGQSLKTATRTANHDLFGLAVLVFQLLMMGRHPFSGIYSIASEDMPIERAIREHRFAYGLNAASRGMSMPPAAAPLEILSDSLASIFESAFSKQGVIIGRPKADRWVTELGELSQSLKQCQRDAGHSHFKALNSCPWCALQNVSGVTLFAAVVTPQHAAIVATPSPDTIDSYLKQLESLTSPGPHPHVPMPASINLPPSPSVAKAAREKRMRRVLSGGIVIGGAALVIWAWPSALLVLLLVVSILYLSHLTYTYETEAVQNLRTQTQEALDKAAVEWASLHDRWQRATATQFDNTYTQVKQAALTYQSLDTTRDTRLQELHRTSRHRQRLRYLQSHSIASTPVTGIGPTRLASLRANGVHTAADITPNVITIDGIGRAYANSLMGWRQYLENQFNLFPIQGVTKADRDEVKKEIRNEQLRLSIEVNQGFAALTQMRSHILAERRTVQPLLESTLRRMRQAEIDLAALK